MAAKRIIPPDPRFIQLLFKTVTHVRISTDKARLDVDAIHRFLSQESTWARGIPLELVHDSIKKVRRFLLVSSAARGLYEKHGFAAPAKPETFMEINVANAYGKA